VLATFTQQPSNLNPKNSSQNYDMPGIKRKFFTTAKYSTLTLGICRNPLIHLAFQEITDNIEPLAKVLKPAELSI